MKNINFLYILYKKRKFHFTIRKIAKIRNTFNRSRKNKKKKIILKNKNMILFRKAFL